VNSQQGQSSLSPNQDLPMPTGLMGIIIMEPSERVKGYWRAMHNMLTNRRDEKGNVIEDVFNGILLLTSQRLMFLRESGLFSKSYQATDIIDLHDIKGATYKDGLISKVIAVDFEQDGILKHESFGGIYQLNPANLKGTVRQSPQAVHALLLESIQSRHVEIDDEKRKERIQYILDFSFLKAQMDEGGIVVRTVKCPSCNASLALPIDGDTLKCTYCGTIIYAQDIFDKMKGLIGDL